MTCLVHLTDLHFGADDPGIVAALAAELRADPPDLVAVSGDLTQGAHLREFRAARHFLDSLGAPWLAVPGNHDISPYDLAERFLDPYARWRAEISTATEPGWRDATTAVLGLNTARRMGLHWDWSRGRYSTDRLRHLAARLDALPPGLVRIVVAHHPLLAAGQDRVTQIAGGAAAALQVLARGRVRLVLAGHLHLRFRRETMPGAGGLIVLQGGSATSTRLRGEPNAYARLRVGQGGDIDIRVRVWADGWQDLSAAAGGQEASPPGPRSKPGRPNAIS